MKSFIIGIDIGTGSVKAVAMDIKGEILNTVQISYPSLSTQNGYHEQNALEIWEAFIDCIKEIIFKVGVSPIAISLSSVMHSLILVDELGNAIAPMMTWADARSGGIADEYKSQIIGKRVYEQTGTPIYSMSPLFKVIWLKENNPSLFYRAHKFIGIKEFVWFKLFTEYQIDYGVASGTGLFNIHEFHWDKEVLALAGIEENRLSALVNTDYYRKDIDFEIAQLLGISTDVNFVIGASDGCLANLGTLAIFPNIAALTIGTSGAIRIASEKPLHNYETMSFNYLLDKKTFICGGPINNGGAALHWLLKDFLKREISNENFNQLFNEAEEISAGCEGLIFLPYITGERAPIWDTKSCGTYFGIKSTHTQAHFSRATLEGICFSLNEVLTSLEYFSEQITQINVSGGFTASKTWIQMLADVTGKKICLIQTEDASAIGAAYLAMKSLDLIQDYSEIKIKFQEIITPNLERHLVYQKYFSIYKQLYTNLKSTMHQLYLLQN